MKVRSAIHIWLGTRPEVIKMAPLVRQLKSMDSMDVTVIGSGQHRELFNDALSTFNINVDIYFKCMATGQTLTTLSKKIIEGFEQVITERKPDLVLVHGDTLTAASVTFAAYLHGIPVGHVEAGLRSHDIKSPWPEEGNRRIIDSMSTLHFAPTEEALNNLENEGSAKLAFMTGNTIVDALNFSLSEARNNLETSNEVNEILGKYSSRPAILVTQHRREKFGAPIEKIFESLIQMADMGAHVIFPVHMNPNVEIPARRILGGREGITLLGPLRYATFLLLMSKSKIVVTDSGGIQEECPSLGIPVLITRDITERPEVINSGGGILVGDDTELLLSSVRELLLFSTLYQKMSLAKSPYGDGNASIRIAKHCLDYLSLVP